MKRNLYPIEICVFSWKPHILYGMGLFHEIKNDLDDKFEQ